MKLYKFVQQIARFKAGDFIKETRIITQQDLDNFSQITGDHNQIHKRSSNNPKPLVHGAFLNSIVTGIIGTKIPGSIVINQNFEFPAKCYADDPIEVHIELTDIRKIIKVKYQVAQGEFIVFCGDAKLMMNKLS